MPKHEQADLTLPQLFEAQAARTPDAVAVTCEGQSLTYRELAVRSNALAAELRARGVGLETRVAVAVDRSLNLIVSLLGIVKAGGAYVPLDKNYPAERIQLILQDSAARIVIADETRLSGLLDFDPNRIIRSDALQHLTAALDEPSVDGPLPENLAYIMYTSGSMGIPKGVEVPHRAIHQLVTDPEYVRITRDDVFLQLATVAFDASTFEIWGALANGARLAIPPAHNLSLAELGQELVKNRITILWLTAALFNQMVDEQIESLGGVTQILTGGDIVSVTHVRRIFDRHPQCRIINGYGPTEGTTFTATCTVPREMSARSLSVPIGRPFGDRTVLLLNARMQPVPVGVPGDLYIGGGGLARGYLNAAGLTAERFVPDPYNPGARLYRSGDTARQLPGGDIEFIGRSDTQVKIRGFRVEPGEIESALRQHPSVDDAVVIARGSKTDEKHLVAYVVPNRADRPHDSQGHIAGSEPAVEQIEHWHELYEDLYGKPCPQQDASFNTIGWNSSYTGMPIDADHMKIWRDTTVERILALGARRVLEIGCGTGLLLLQAASHVQEYCGTDFSAAAIEYVRDQLPASEAWANHVSLRHQPADDFTGLREGYYDAVVINSVVQYFPSMDYLIRVLRGVARILAPGGNVFLGDIRDFSLLEAFHTSVQLHLAPDRLPVSELRARVTRHMQRDDELLIDPRFFLELPRNIPEFRGARILPKRGRYENELSKFRYDVLLSASSRTVRSVAGNSETTWNWGSENGLESVRRKLEYERPDVLRIENVPGRRIAADLAALNRLAQASEESTAADIRRAVVGAGSSSVEQEDIFVLAEEFHYAVSFDPARSGKMGEYDIRFSSSSASAEAGIADSGQAIGASGESESVTNAVAQDGWWRRFGNDLEGSAQARRFIPVVRRHLETTLPSYMVPSFIVVMDSLPLTTNGKIDRKVLPAPESVQSHENKFVAPTTETQRQLCAIWEEVLGIERVGVTDNFFSLGGHSLLATKIISRVRDTLHKELPVRAMFEAPTVLQLSEHCDTAPLASAQETPALAPIARQRRQSAESTAI